VKVCFTGGGTGGHVFPAFAIDRQLAQHLKDIGEPYQRFWLGSAAVAEQRWVHDAGIRHIAICSGKLRRYFSWRTPKDMAAVVLGIFQALRVLRREQPDVVFSKGGYVSVPVMIASYLLRIPSITHESDALPGLATRINGRFAQLICIPFPQAAVSYAKSLQAKLSVTGIPVRFSAETTDRQRALHHFSLTGDRPIIVVLGGSQGAQQINRLVWDTLDPLLDLGQVVHQTGNHEMMASERKDYHPFAFIDEHLDDLLCSATVVISRSGATAIAEFMELRVPMILLPLGLHASRGDQIANAQRLEKFGAALVLSPEMATAEQFLTVVKKVVLHDSVRRSMIEAAATLHVHRGAHTIAQLLVTHARDTGKRSVTNE
jgi:UDP-N-acetylglucosamine--N-acetylmuramyl-(pentapeptide) pyrophosphoryl-undecaprenol N-acetylglucosamine transferase